MTEPIILPPGVSVAILAFLLSLLPAGLFMWVWYLRRHDRPVPTGAVVKAFVVGVLLVVPAFILEQQAPKLWSQLSPETAFYFSGALLSVQTWSDVIWPAFGTFVVVALIEEGLRYAALWGWFRRSPEVDQVFDGMVIGLAAGLGFATLENTLYFFDLFAAGQFDTLVFVFFLRFLISTLAHISFGGVMGVLLARAAFSMYRRRWLYAQAFFVPWFMHGIYDWLLGVNLTMYAVLMLLVPLAALAVWSGRRDFFVRYRRQRGMLVDELPPENRGDFSGMIEVNNSPWNTTGIWRRRLMQRPKTSSVKKYA